MNLAYLSRVCLKASSNRTGRVVVLGCFDSAFRGAKLFLLLSSSVVHYNLHYKLLAPTA